MRVDSFASLIAALPFPEIDPVIVRIGPLAVHWYGLGYVVGILIGWWYGRRLVSDDRLWGGKSPITPADIDDAIVWLALGIVLGGRLGYVLFYDLPRFLETPSRIVAIWEGGMSYHGGMLGALLAFALMARARGIAPLSMLDVLTASAPPAIGLVRVANFVNSELWGRVTDVPWAFVFPNGGPEPRHPSQLYEALLEGLLLFLVLRLLTHRFHWLRRPGAVGGAYLIVYGLSRLFVEQFRVPDAQLGYLLGTGWLTMGMVLTAPMLAVGIWLVARARKPAARA